MVLFSTTLKLMLLTVFATVASTGFGQLNTIYNGNNLLPISALFYLFIRVPRVYLKANYLVSLIIVVNLKVLEITVPLLL